MRVIPVLDVRSGRAVRAIAGDRAHYGPLRSVLHGGTDPVVLARAARDAWSLPDLYLADLDAIVGEEAPDLDLYRAVRDLGLTPWVDAGVRDPGDVAPLIAAGVERVVVGLETVCGPGALAEILAGAGPDRVVFSLDLLGGRPMVDTVEAWGTDRASALAAIAAGLGVRRIILLDLARVGTGGGVALPDPPARGVEWILGGGVGSAEELRALEAVGIGGVLIGSALHDGRIGADDLRSISGRRTS